MKIFNIISNGIGNILDNTFSMFYDDEFIITEEDIDFYRNYYLKNKIHPKYTFETWYNGI